jgi:hypothetical protein
MTSVTHAVPVTPPMKLAYMGVQPWRPSAARKELVQAIAPGPRQVREESAGCAQTPNASQRVQTASVQLTGTITRKAAGQETPPDFPFKS